MADVVWVGHRKKVPMSIRENDQPVHVGLQGTLLFRQDI